MQNPYYNSNENNENNENKNINDIDLNLNNYTLEDIFKILNININEIVEKDEYEIRQQIEKKLDQVITKFNNINLTEFSRFFENIKSKLIKDEEVLANLLFHNQI